MLNQFFSICLIVVSLINNFQEPLADIELWHLYAFNHSAENDETRKVRIQAALVFELCLWEGHRLVVIGSGDIAVFADFDEFSGVDFAFV